MEEWVLENHVGATRSPVILTSGELEDEQAQHNSALDGKVVNAFDEVLRSALRYMRLTCLYVIRESEIQAWYIPVRHAVSIR